MTRSGGCNCGRVRIEAQGEPIRVGICHCHNCRRETGSPFMAYAVFPAAAVTVTGETASWSESGRYFRHACPACGSPVHSTETDTDEIEVRLGCLDAAPSDLTPTYELWVIRREPWLAPLPGARQYKGNRED